MNEHAIMPRSKFSLRVNQSRSKILINLSASLAIYTNRSTLCAYSDTAAPVAQTGKSQWEMEFKRWSVDCAQTAFQLTEIALSVREGKPFPRSSASACSICRRTYYTNRADMFPGSFFLFFIHRKNCWSRYYSREDDERTEALESALWSTWCN